MDLPGRLVQIEIEPGVLGQELSRRGPHRR